ncbi:hypothetical protein [Gordonia westfalica]|uniref:hypothetical protein n=1 Tax=Gordonia westfalica TaxID=158898 RepID=UPI00094302BE|nr:hypothetical protein [Gordonia westfalica]
MTGTHHVTTIPATGEPVFVIFPPGEDDAIELTRPQLWQHIDALLTLLKRTPIPTRTLEAS